MALTYTPRSESRSTLPDFQSKTVFGETFDSRSLHDLPVKCVVFICGHCPYVLAIEDRLIALARKLEALGGRLVGICSNDPAENVEDRPENLAERAKLKGYGFPYVIDDSQKIAKDFGAVCTPDFFVYDRSNVLQYRGRLDDSWRDPAKVQKEELYEAAKRIAARTIADDGEMETAPSMGCSIKWKD